MVLSTAEKSWWEMAVSTNEWTRVVLLLQIITLLSMHQSPSKQQADLRAARVAREALFVTHTICRWVSWQHEWVTLASRPELHFLAHFEIPQPHPSITTFQFSLQGLAPSRRPHSSDRSSLISSVFCAHHHTLKFTEGLTCDVWLKQVVRYSVLLSSLVGWEWYDPTVC